MMTVALCFHQLWKPLQMQIRRVQCFSCKTLQQALVFRRNSWLSSYKQAPDDYTESARVTYNKQLANTVGSFGALQCAAQGANLWQPQISKCEYTLINHTPVIVIIVTATSSDTTFLGSRGREATESWLSGRHQCWALMIQRMWKFPIHAIFSKSMQEARLTCCETPVGC